MKTIYNFSDINPTTYFDIQHWLRVYFIRQNKLIFLTCYTVTNFLLCSYLHNTYKALVQELKITPILDKLLEYKRSWIQHVNRMPRNRLPRIMKYFSPAGTMNHGRPLKRLLDTWDRNGSTSCPTPWKIYNDDDDDGVLVLEFLHTFVVDKKNVCNKIEISTLND